MRLSDIVDKSPVLKFLSLESVSALVESNCEEPPLYLKNLISLLKQKAEQKKVKEWFILAGHLLVS